MVMIISLLMVAAAPYIPVRSKSFRIASVGVTQTGIASPRQPGYPLDRCKSFRPNARQVSAWFKSAHRVSVAATIEADREQCVARGTLRTIDGRSYKWEIDQAGLAVVVIPTADNLYFMGREFP